MNFLHSTKVLTGLLLVLSLGWVGAWQVQGCGISWNKPSFHFDSVNEWGYVSYWEEIGTVDMGGREIPLFINFLSNKRTSSCKASVGIGKKARMR